MTSVAFSIHSYLNEVALIPHSFELYRTATATPADMLRTALVVTGLAIMLTGIVMLYRWGRNDLRAGTSSRFALRVAVTITGTVLAVVGATPTFVPSASMSAADAVAASSTQRRAAGSPAERRTGRIVLTDGHAVDLDSREDDWDVARAKYIHFGKTLDLRLYTLLDVHVGIVKVAPRADYFDCAGSTGRRTEIAHDDFARGDTFCVESDEGRWARVVITSKDTDNTCSTRVKMDVLVWEKAGR